MHNRYSNLFRERYKRLCGSSGDSENSVRESLKKSNDELKKSLLDQNSNSDRITNNPNDVTTENFMDIDMDFLNSLKINRSYLSILSERFMQTVDDWQLSNQIKQKYRDLKNNKNSLNNPSLTTSKERIVILGTGWAGHSFLKTVDSSKYDVTIISPRNYFTFTPMLAASAVGTVDFRSICEPIRNVNPFVNYIEATATDIDPNKKVLELQSVKCEGTACEISEFNLKYDHLLIAVGATVNTFGIKGVRENCQFLKQIEDAANLRKAIAYCFERANIPNLDDEEIRSALSFVIVGAGPTGVEFTSELRDWMENEGRRYFPRLLKYVRITLVEAGNAVLPVFNEQLQKEALKKLTARETSLINDGLIPEEMTRVLLQSGVKEVGEKMIEFTNGDKIPYGFCVWAAGNGPLPIVLQLIEKVQEQKAGQSKARGRLIVDRWLRLSGANNIFAIGDCSFTSESPLPATAQVASQQGSYLGRLFSKGFDMNAVAPSPPWKTVTIQQEYEDDSSTSDVAGVSNSPDRKNETINNFINKINDNVDNNNDIRFASERIKIGKLGVTTKRKVIAGQSSDNNDDNNSDEIELIEYANPFQFLNLGVLTYIGASEALAEINVNKNIINGKGAVGFLLWRGIYWFKQVSWKNRFLVGLDWVKARVFGREIGSLY
eukprot:gene4189-5960_t